MATWAPQPTFPKRFWIGCAVALLGISFLVSAILQSRDVRALAQHGIPVPAQVIATRTQSPNTGSDDAPTFHITYQFSSQGQTITNERRVPAPFFNRHPTGTEWKIHTHPDDPTLHDLYPGETKQNTWGLLATSAVLIIIGAILSLSSGLLTALKTRS